MNEHEKLAQIAVDLDGIKERFEDSCLLARIVKLLHRIAKRHNPANYENLDIHQGNE